MADPSPVKNQTGFSSSPPQQKGKKFVYRDGRFTKQRFLKRKEKNFSEADVKFFFSMIVKKKIHHF